MNDKLFMVLAFMFLSCTSSEASTMFCGSKVLHKHSYKNHGYVCHKDCPDGRMIVVNNELDRIERRLNDRHDNFDYSRSIDDYLRRVHSSDVGRGVGPGGILNNYPELFATGQVKIIHELPPMMQTELEHEKVDTVTVQLIPIKIKTNGKTRKFIGITGNLDRAMSDDLRGRIKSIVWSIYDLGWRVHDIRPVLIENNRGLENPHRSLNKGQFHLLTPEFKKAMITNKGGLQDKLGNLVDLINQQEEIPKGILVEYIIKISVDYSMHPPYESIFELRRKFGYELYNHEKDKYGGIDFTQAVLEVQGTHKFVNQVKDGQIKDVAGMTVNILSIQEGWKK